MKLLEELELNQMELNDLLFDLYVEIRNSPTKVYVSDVIEEVIVISRVPDKLTRKREKFMKYIEKLEKEDRDFLM